MHYPYEVEVSRQRHIELLEQARQDRLAGLANKQRSKRNPRPGLVNDLLSKVIG